MGGKSAPQMPPPVDTSVQDRQAESEAKLAAEKEKALSQKKKGMMSNILTSGQGVEEEATVATSLLGGKK